MAHDECVGGCGPRPTKAPGKAWRNVMLFGDSDLDGVDNIPHEIRCATYVANDPWCPAHIRDALLRFVDKANALLTSQRHSEGQDE
jgi:hypothetical protein